MMFQISEDVTTLLRGFDVDNSNVFDGSIFPLVAPIEAIYPFCVYAVRKTTEFSKQGVHDVFIEIRIVGKNYEQLCMLSDSIEELFEARNEYHYESTDAAVNPDLPTEINIAIKFNVKII